MNGCEPKLEFTCFWQVAILKTSLDGRSSRSALQLHLNHLDGASLEKKVIFRGIRTGWPLKCFIFGSSFEEKSRRDKNTIFKICKEFKTEKLIHKDQNISLLKIILI